MASPMLDDALARLDTALGLLEAAARRRIESERGRANLETELVLMQDDRSRLAGELDGAAARLGQVENAAREVDRRLERTMAAVEAALAPAHPAPASQDH